MKRLKGKVFKSLHKVFQHGVEGICSSSWNISTVLF